MNSVGRTMDGPFSLPVLYNGPDSNDQNSPEPDILPISQYNKTNTQISEKEKLTEKVEHNMGMDTLKDRPASDKTTSDKIDIQENGETTFERKDRNSQKHHSDESEHEGHLVKSIDNTVRIKTEPEFSPVTSSYANNRETSVPDGDIRSDDDDVDDESIHGYDAHRDNDKFGFESPSGNNNKHGTNYEQQYTEKYRPVREQYSRSEFREKLRRGDLNSYEGDRRHDNQTPEDVRVNNTTYSPNGGAWPGFPIPQSNRFNSVDRKSYEQRFLPTENEYSDRLGIYDPTSYTNTIAAMLQRFDLPDRNGSNPYSTKFGGMPASRALTFHNGEPGDVRDQSSNLLSPRSNQHFNSSNLMSPQRPGKVGSSQYSCHICKFVGTTEEGFKEHMKCHFEHLCPECSYSSRTEGRLRRHMQDFHGSKPPAFDNSVARRNGAIKPKLIKCRHCPFETMIKEESWAHCRLHIKEGKELCCTRCEFVTEFKHHMEYHIRNHIGSKPHKCPKCQYECVNKSMLNSHMKSHTNVYRYRCATCSYATKYAHSLKIHLRKKKHEAAIVLNEDGSMPVDGMGNFDLLSKRGPPRGPRSVSRKSGHPETEPGGSDVSPNEMGDTINMYSPDTSGRQEMDSSFWLAPHSQPIINSSSPARVAVRNNTDFTPGRLSLFPSNTIDYNTRPAFPDDRVNVTSARISTPSMMNHSPYHKINQLINAARPSQVLSSVVYPQSNLSASLSSPMKCKLCRLTCNSLKDLSQHFMQMHPSEGHEILASVGIYPDMVSALTWPSPTLSEQSRRVEEQSHSTSPLFSKVSPRVSSEFSNDGSSYSTEDHRADLYVTPRKAPFPEKHNLDSPVVAIKIEAGKTKEAPLDLSSSYPVIDRRMERKRMSEEEDDDEMFLSAPSSRNESPNVTSNVLRKRSRKGKACRIDVLNQESWDEERINYGDSKADAPELNSPYHRNLKALEHTSVEVPLTSLEVPLNRDGDEKKDGGNAEIDFQTKVNSADSTERIVSDEEEEAVVCSSKPDAEFHVCTHCNIGFRDRVMHSIHMGYHGFKDPFKCNMCGTRTSDRMEFFLHMAKVAHE